MMSFPQLRVRSGYSYGAAYGRFPEIIERAKEIESPFVAIVDDGTWGHVRWEQAATKAELPRGFGMEIPIKCADDGEKALKLKAWVLAKDTRKFYRLTSKSVQNQGLTPQEFQEADGVIKFAGEAYAHLDLAGIDYIDINPASMVAAHGAMETSRAFGKPVVITSYNDMPSIDHADFASAWKVRESVGLRHIATEEELWSRLRHIMTREEFDSAITNTRAVVEQLADVKLAKAPMIHLDGDIVALAREGQAYRLSRGHIKEWTQEYEDRFQEEIKQIQLKDFDSYFLVVADLVAFAKKHMLVGPARGSSAGSLVCYLLGITEVDPLPHRLLFQRFIDISRSDLPDIDIDFADTHRYLVFEYLQQKYGTWNVVKLGNINTLKAASVIAHVGKRFGIPFHDTDNIKNSIIEYTSADERYGKGLEDTFEKTQPGRDFREKYEIASACMGDLEIHPSHSGVHAAGILVCNDEVIDFCTVTSEGVAQLDKPDSEYLNLLKIDALGLRTLGVIQDANCVTAQELYDLPLNDKAVLDVLNEDKMSGIFQFEGQAVRSVANAINITAFENIDHITALTRPGPLSSGMAIKYIKRVAGREPVTYTIPQVEQYLSGTYGVFLYQEQIMSIVKDIGQFDWEQTSAIRKAMSARKGEEFFNKRRELFIEGAKTIGVAPDDAHRVWQEMVTFGAWGFNRSHSVSYAVVTYWTCYMKRYHRLEYAAACLRAAKDDQQTVSILRELAKEGVEYTALDPEHSELNWVVADGRLIGGIMNAKGFGPAKAEKFLRLRDDVKAARIALANCPISAQDVEDKAADVAALEAQILSAKISQDKELEKLLKADLKELKADLKGLKAQYKELAGTHLKTLQDWEKVAASLSNSEVQFADLNEAHTLWGHAYDNPELVGVTSGNPIRNIRDIRDGDDGLVIVKMVKKVLSDENEPIRQKKRADQGKNPVYKGQSQFLDIMCVDDSVDQPIHFRIRPEKYLQYGKQIAEGTPTGSWFLIKGWKLSGIDMFIVKAVKRILTEREKAKLAAQAEKVSKEGEGDE